MAFLSDIWNIMCDVVGRRGGKGYIENPAETIGTKTNRKQARHSSQSLRIEKLGNQCKQKSGNQKREREGELEPEARETELLERGESRTSEKESIILTSIHLTSTVLFFISSRKDIYFCATDNTVGVRRPPPQNILPASNVFAMVDLVFSTTSFVATTWC
jgi:hypothetical protein